MKVRYELVDEYEKCPAEKKPMTAGRKLNEPYVSSAPSMDGMSSDQTDAATMTPEAKPKNSVLSLPESSPLKMNTSAAPAVVAMKMIQKPSTVIAVVVKSALLSRRYFFPTNSLE